MKRAFLRTAGGSVSYVGAGGAINKNYQNAARPTVPAAAVAGDMLLCLSVARSAGDNVLSSTWTTLSIADTSGFYILASYKIADGADAAPTITPVNMTPGQTHVSRVTAWRGVDLVQPFGPASTAAQVSSSQDVTNIAPPAYAPGDGAVIVLGARFGSWTSADTLTGDGLTWVEAWDEVTTIPNTLSWVIDYAIWTGAAPTLTAKTFTITGGTASSNIGQMWTLNAARGKRLLHPPSAFCGK